MTNREQRGNFDLDRVTGSLTSRRTVARGLAWTVPVISVAAAAPAFATSCQTFTFDQTNSYKCSGSSTPDVKGYYLSICYNCPPGQVPPDGVITSNLTIVAVRTNPVRLTVTPILEACNTLPQEVTIGDCTPLIHFNSTTSSTPLFITYFFTDDPDKVEYTLDVPAPPERSGCLAPRYCCTSTNPNVPFPQKHECPPRP